MIQEGHSDTILEKKLILFFADGYQLLMLQQAVGVSIYSLVLYDKG